MGFAAPIAIALSAIGTGISFIGGMQQARAAQAIAEQNANIARMNARNEAEALRAQATIQANESRQNFLSRQAEATQMFANARAKQDQARAQEAINAENIRRRGEEGRKLMAAQQARFSAAGIVESTGSPLALAAMTAGAIERDKADSIYANELALTGLYHEAGMERLGGQYALAGATMQRNTSRAESSLRMATAAARQASGDREAEIIRLAGQAQSAGARYSAFGNLFGGLGGLGSQYSKLSDVGAFG